MSNPVIGYVYTCADPINNYLTEYKDFTDYIPKKQLLMEASGSVANTSAIGTRMLDNGVSAPLSGTNLTSNMMKTIYLDASQYPATIGGLSRKLRLEATLLTNTGVNTLNTFTIQLYDITTAGGVAQMILTAVNPVGNTITYTNPSSSSIIYSQSTSFNFPATNSYIICISNNVILTSLVGVNVMLYLVYE